ncbi:MAG: DNA-directed RNA polymerase subunit beta, partial [bacterium]|nr:DNA-directed RNA polymerase subunit beta [bacterium]
MKTKSFAKTKVSLPLPYLISIQKDSWQLFLERDLKELFQEISPIRDYTKKELELWFLDYKLDEPKYKTDLEAKQNNDSFEAALRVRTKLVNLKTKEIKEQEVYLADFPLMTERGTFIVNGVERVAVPQLIRSPGAFFTGQRVGDRNNFGAKIIPNRGTWLEFETEQSGVIGVKIDRRRKIMATTLLRAFGIDKDESIKETFQDVDRGETKYIEETLKRDTTHNQAEAFVEIYQRLRPGDLATADTARELIENMFFNFERYDLSKVGRWRMWQRLPALHETDTKQKAYQTKKEEKIGLQDRVLRLKDVIAVIKEIIRLNNDPQAKPDQIDHLGNRRVRTLNELLQNRLRVGLMRMERI